MSDSNLGKSLLFFLGGAAVGAALGVLLAPDKGERTRNNITRTARDLKDNVVDRLEDLVASAEDIVDSFKFKEEDTSAKQETKQASNA